MMILRNCFVTTFTSQQDKLLWVGPKTKTMHCCLRHYLLKCYHHFKIKCYFCQFRFLKQSKHSFICKQNFIVAMVLVIFDWTHLKQGINVSRNQINLIAWAYAFKQNDSTTTFFASTFVCYTLIDLCKTCTWQFTELSTLLPFSCPVIGHVSQILLSHWLEQTVDWALFLLCQATMISQKILSYNILRRVCFELQVAMFENNINPKILNNQIIDLTQRIMLNLWLLAPCSVKNTPINRS